MKKIGDMKRIGQKTLLVLANAAPLFSIAMALILEAIILEISGYDSISVYKSIFSSAYLDSFGLGETLVRSIPLVICGLSVAICLHASLWNIGAEGQMLLGCLFSGWVALNLAFLPSFALIFSMLAAGFLGGALWASVAGFFRSRYEVNEILTTLLMNYIAIYLIEYFVYGPWKDPKGGGFPNTPLFSEKAWFSGLGWGRMHAGCFVAAIAVSVIYLLLKYTRLGFEIRIVGNNVKAALYAGISVKKTIFLTMLLSGGLAGLAGAVEIAGMEHRLHHNMYRGDGFTAIIIAWLAGKHPLWIVPVSILMAGLIIGGEEAQMTHKIPITTVNVLQGIILFFILFSNTIEEKMKFYFLHKLPLKDLPEN